MRLLLRFQIELFAGRFAVFFEVEDLLSEVCFFCPRMVVQVQQTDGYHDNLFEAADVSERLEDAHIGSLVGLRDAARRELDDAVRLTSFARQFMEVAEDLFGISRSILRYLVADV